MAEKRKRSQNFTYEEKDKLVKLISDHKNTILNKKTDGTTNEAKLLAWNQLTASFNQSSRFIDRTKESLMKVWEKLKSESKLYYSRSRTSAIQTGGQPSAIKTDPILEQVCSIMGLGCSISDSDPLVDEVEDQSVAFEEVLYPEESQPKVPCIEEISVKIEPDDFKDIDDTEKSKETLKRTPLWSRRRAVSYKNSERAKSDAMTTICSSYKNINKRKEDVENLKYLVLQEDLETKRKLNQLQLQAAEKDLVIKDLEIEIKKAILQKVKGDGLYKCDE